MTMPTGFPQSIKHVPVTDGSIGRCIISCYISSLETVKVSVSTT